MRVHGVLVTFNRPEWLERSLDALAGQSFPLDQLVIVDNGTQTALHGPDTRSTARTVRHISTGENLGPAGGLALGLDEILPTVSDDDWIIFLDDDDPPSASTDVADLVTFGERLVGQGCPVGAVGMAGARLDSRTGSLVRPLDGELDGPIRVDVIGGGQLPAYRAEALRRVGGMRPALFWGFEELDLGLRLSSAGYGLYVNGPSLRLSREQNGRLGLARSLAEWRASAPTWRTYYYHRNSVEILCRHGMARAATRRSAILLAKAMVAVLRSPRVGLPLLTTTLRALFDGWTGRLGRIVDPGV